MRDDRAERPDADGAFAGGGGGAGPRDPAREECSDQERPQPYADKTAGDEVIQGNVVCAVGQVLRAPALAIRPQYPQVGKSEVIESDELRLEAIPDEAPHVWRGPRDEHLAPELATPAVERAQPDLKAEPTGGARLHVANAAQPTQQRDRTQRQPGVSRAG